MSASCRRRERLPPSIIERVPIHDIGSTSDGQLYIVMGTTRRNAESETRPRAISSTTERSLTRFNRFAAGWMRRTRAASPSRYQARQHPLCRDGVVKVLDFGIARRFSTTTDCRDRAGCLDTQAGRSATVNYMAPGTASRNATRPAKRHLFLGVLIYGWPPDDGHSPDRSGCDGHERDREGSRDLTQVCPARPEWLAQIVTKALAKGAKTDINGGRLRNSLLESSGGSHDLTTANGVYTVRASDPCSPTTEIELVSELARETAMLSKQSCSAACRN